MKLCSITENIEMELFSSEELTQETQEEEEEEEEEHRLIQKQLDHPLVPDKEEEEPEPECETQPRLQAKPKAEPPARVEMGHYVPVPPGAFVEEIEIEMEVFPLKGSTSETVQNKVRCVRWRKMVPQRTGLMVRDVMCLPTGGQSVPQGRERAALVAMGMAARITIDSSWSANQMQRRLEMLFSGKFAKRTGLKFIYLQGLQGSRALFVPDVPAEGWTGEQVLRISAHGPLYVSVQQDQHTQVESARSVQGTPVVDRTGSAPSPSPPLLPPLWSSACREPLQEPHIYCRR